MNQYYLTNSTVLEHRNNAPILKLCWDAWAFTNIITTNITAIATTTTTTTSAAAAGAAATFFTTKSAAAADNSNTLNYVIAITNAISATTKKVKQPR
jgi:hypothetical protein